MLCLRWTGFNLKINKRSFGVHGNRGSKSDGVRPSDVSSATNAKSREISLPDNSNMAT